MGIETVGMKEAGAGKRLPVIIVNGGQWGSEAKGLVTHKLTMEKSVDYAVRTGTVNAGHTVYYNGKAYAMQQLPVSWVRPECNLVIGAGAFIHPDILMREIEWIMIATQSTMEDVISRIWIDRRCGIHLPAHTEKAKAADRHHSIGTTGKGCSEAVVGKIMGRSLDYPPSFAAWLQGKPGFWEKVAGRLIDTSLLLNNVYDNGCQILVEGTQGTLLDLHLGDYPYTTHKQTQAASWLAEAGLSCTLPTDLWLVMRTYPIKVAGNSGPMPGEISWSMLARRINGSLDRPLVSPEAISEWNKALLEVRNEWWPECPSFEPGMWTQAEKEHNRMAASELHKKAFNSLPERTQKELRKLFEFTTVTNKLRRVAEWDWDLAYKSLRMNRPHHIALTFANYMWPQLWGARREEAFKNSKVWGPWVGRAGKLSVELGGGPVDMISFGPQIEHTHLINGDQL